VPYGLPRFQANQLLIRSIKEGVPVGFFFVKKASRTCQGGVYPTLMSGVLILCCQHRLLILLS
ncbi:MAG: hypothetical protein M3Y58_03870, partial [Chloroflexota bacterium]|nr:hypothetical protein [Chloroflexota bacterium]